MPAAVVMRAIYAHLCQGEWTRARALCEEALVAHPSCATLHHSIGLSFCGEGAFERALPYLTRALALDASNRKHRRDAAAVLARVGRWNDAVDALEPALEHLEAETLTLLLLAARQAGRASTSLAALHSRREELPVDCDFLLAYGRTLADAGQDEDAESVLSRCVALQPERADAHDALAHLYNETGRPDLALRHWRESARLSPRSSYRQLRLAMALCDRGLADEGRRQRELAEALGPERDDEHSARVYLMLFDPRETAPEILHAARQTFAGAEGAPSRKRARVASAGRRLRVAYLSGEFRSSPAVYFFEPFLAHHDRSALEVFLYSTCPSPDSVTPRFVRWANHWRDVARLHRDALARQILDDRIDVVVDLSGHFPHNRLACFGDLPAARFTYPNFPGTTGCPGVDWLITDHWTSPPGTECEYSEQLCRVRPGYLAFAPPRELPEHASIPPGSRPPTFGVFQRLLKFNADFWDVLGRVMARVPDARLVVQNGDIELGRPDSNTSRMVTRRLKQYGIAPSRVTIRGPLSRPAHIAGLPDVDVALDTFPYAGQTTTCESLWMGIPVVTLPRDTHVSRVSAGLVTRTGHPEWVADSPDSYVRIAADLVQDVDVLTRIRATLRSEFVQAGLTDGRTLASELEAAYRMAVQS